MDVVLITIDSLRPFSMGAYDPAYGAAGLATTPQLDAFARGARVFDRAYTSGGWTSIAMSSILRGLYPRRLAWTSMYETNRFRLLRARDTRSLPQGEWTTKMFPLPVGDRHLTLPELLARREMITVAVVDDEFSELLSLTAGVGRGFHTQYEVDDLPAAQRSDAGTADLAIHTLARMPVGARFFLWVHFFGPHSPTYVRPGYRLDGNNLKQAYEHELRFVDAQVGRLLRVLAERPQPTAVFVTADHGEDFPTKIDRHHGYSVADGVVRVPLLVRVPGWGNGRSSVPVSLVDLMPTILELTQTPAPKGLDGRSITALLEGIEPRVKRALLADTWQYDRLGRLVLAESGAMDGRSKATFDPLRNLWTLEQPEKDGTRVRRAVSPKTKHPLVRALSRYIDQTGGALQLRR
jgi:arylsulfatase A-like enzyme